jgi:nitroimidazol reductase NimA-like FMN-containing flavoprotein (pyridoxamine 5'-phosphate oxidase superfamily)
MTADSFPPDETLESLDPRSCERLLAATAFGRLALIEGGLPRLIVLNHTVMGKHLLFRTRDDSLPARLTADGAVVPAAFEVDSALQVDKSGWSVIATGQLSREPDPEQVAAARAHITAWAYGERDTVLRMEVEGVTGRRVGPL